MFDGEHCRHPSCSHFSVVKFSDAGHNRSFSSYCCGLRLTFNLAVFLNERINHAFGLRLRCRGWSTAAGPVISVLFIDLKTTNPASELTSMVSSPQRLLKRPGLEPSAVRNSVTTLRIVCTSTKSAILHCYCVERMTDWIIDDPCGDGQCRYPVGKARNCRWRHI